MNVRRRIKSALETVGYYRDRLAASPYHGVAVLAYHGVRSNALPPGAVHSSDLHVTAARLDAHCRALRDLGCSFLSLADWSAIASGRQPLPPRSVMLTFDDGYRNLLTEGLPILERHDIPAAAFICTSPIERRVRFWFDAVAEHGGAEAVERAKALGFEEWRRLVTRVEVHASENDPHAPLTIPELQRLAGHPLITIGAHTVSHPILARAPRDVQRAEIQGSKATLETWLQQPVRAFAFPNGRPGVDYDAETLAALEDAGIEFAFTVHEAFAAPTAGCHEHPRFLMLNSVDAPELAHRIAVTWPRDQVPAV